MTCVKFDALSDAGSSFKLRSMTDFSSAEREVRVSQWDGFALLGICTGVYVYNWLLQYTLLPLDQCLWAAFLAGFPAVFISRVQVAELEMAHPEILPAEAHSSGETSIAQAA